MNYQDSSGAWQQIDPSLRKGSSGSYTTTATPAAVTLPASLPDGVSVGTSAGTVHFALNGAAAVAPTVSGTTATYASALPGVDVMYDSGNSALKENLILANASAPSTFAFTLSTTNGLRLSTSGNTVAVTTAGGTQVFGLAAPTVSDASHTWAGDTGGAVALSVQPVAGQSNAWTVTERIDPAWLAGSARVFPVTLDPVVTFGSASAEQGCWYASDSPTTNRCGDSSYVLGHGGAPGTGGAGRMLLEFPDLTTAIPQDAVVTDADLSLYESGQENSNTVPIEAMRMTQQWNSSATYNTYDGTNNWASPGGDFVPDPNYVWINSNIAGHVGSRVDFYPTPAVADWVDGEQPNDGLILKGLGTELSIDNYLFFTSWASGTSSQWPTLTVDWDRTYNGGTKISDALSDHLSVNVDPAGGNGQIVQAGSSFSAPGVGFSPSWAYNSTRGASGPIGAGWTSNTAGDVQLLPNGGGAKLIGPYGNPSFYQLQQTSTGAAQTDGGGNTLYITPPGQNADLSSHPDTAHGGTIYTLTFHSDQQKWTFHSIPTCTALTPDQSCTILGTQVDRNGNGLTFNYDTAHFSPNHTYPPTSAVDAAGRTFTFGEQSSSPYLTTGITDPSSRSWSFTHATGSSNDVTVVTDPTGAQTSYGYDSSGRINAITTAHTSSSGGSVAVTAIGYDSSNRVTSIKRVTNPTAAPGSWTGPTTTFTYNGWTTSGSGAITATTVVTDPLSHATTYTYDTHDNITMVTDADSHTRATSYTSNFDQSTLTDGLSAVTTLSHDDINNLTKVQAPDMSGGGTGSGRTGTLDYPSHTGGTAPYPMADYQPSDEKDSAGNQTNFSYDTAGNLQTVQPNATGGGGGGPTLTNKYQGDPGVTSCGGKTGELCSTTDGLGHVTTYAYDASGNPTSVTPPAPLHATTTTYDTLGRVTSVTDGNGNKTTYGYDSDDRITSLEFGGHTSCTSGDISAGNCIMYGYDGDGNLLTRKDSTGTTTFGYDVLNRVTSKLIPGVTPASSVTYDAASNVATYTDAGGTVTYGYDPANLLTSLAEPGGSCTGTVSRCTTFTNDANGNRTQVVYPSGEKIVDGFDTSGRESSISAYRPGASSTFFARTLSYSTSGASPKDTDLVQTSTDTPGVTTTDSYDGYNRLTTAAVGSTTYGYGYDVAGNRTQASKTGASTQYYGYDNANQLCWSGTTSGSNGTTACPSTPSGDTGYTYDTAGNQLTGGISSVYNSKGQTTSATLGATTTTFGYADLDQTERTSSTGGGTTTGQATGLLGLAITQAGSASPVYFTRDPDGNPISMRVGAGGTSTNSYYLLDQQGSVLRLTDATGNTDTASYTYDPYGTSLTATGTQATINPYRYGTGYYDATTGLLKLGARYDNPSIGRFTTRDSSTFAISDPTQINDYLYAGDGPTNGTDPSGHGLFSDIVGAGLGVASFFGEGLVAVAAGAAGIVLGVGIIVVDLAKRLDNHQSGGHFCDENGDNCETFSR